MRQLPTLSLLFLWACGQQSQNTSVNQPIEIESELNWLAFTPEIFDQAKQENKLVILHIGAQWCHWCHVMEDSTYSDLKVEKLLLENFITCKEDQDSRPDLFSKYRAYGWPAIIVFDSDKNELLKLRGFQEPVLFADLLEKVIENPAPIETEASSKNQVDTLSGTNLLSYWKTQLDFANGGFNTFNKSLFSSAFNVAMLNSIEDDSLFQWLETSISNSYKLNDPVWGGVFQYSTHRDWDHPHFERLLREQAEYMIMYCTYGAYVDDQEAIKKAEKIYDYCNTFLSTNRPFFNNSQDADYKKGTESSNYYTLNDEDRRNLGVPIVHELWCLKENAMMVEALICLWAVTENNRYRVRSEHLLKALLDEYHFEKGLYFREKGKTIFALDDQVAILNTTLLAFQVTNDSSLLEKAESMYSALLTNFMNEDSLFYSACGDITLEPDLNPISNLQTAFCIQRFGDVTNNFWATKHAHSIAEKIQQVPTNQSALFVSHRLLIGNYMDAPPLTAIVCGKGYDAELMVPLLYTYHSRCQFHHQSPFCGGFQDELNSKKNNPSPCSIKLIGDGGDYVEFSVVLENTADIRKFFSKKKLR